MLSGSPQGQTRSSWECCKESKVPPKCQGYCIKKSLIKGRNAQSMMVGECKEYMHIIVPCMEAVENGKGKN